MSLFEGLDDSIISSPKKQTSIDEVRYPYLVDPKNFRDLSTFPPMPEIFSKQALAARPGMSWLNTVEFILLQPNIPKDVDSQKEQLDKLFDKLLAEAKVLKTEHYPGLLPPGFEAPIIAFDTETTGLDTRVMYDYEGNLTPLIELVGMSLAVSPSEGYYLPILHTEEDGIPNWTLEAIMYFIQRMFDSFCVVNHNASYDREVTELWGAECRPFPYFLDTQILFYLRDVDHKKYNLKGLSETFLNQKMIKIEELFPSKKKEEHISFKRLPASNAYIYGGADATQTLSLLIFVMSESNQNRNPLISQPLPTSIDHRISDVRQNMSRLGWPIHYKKSIYSALDCIVRVSLVEQRVYRLVGKEISLGSPAQVSDLLFDEFGLPTLPGMERGPNGKFSTGEDILDELYELYPDYEILRLVVQYRKLKASISKFFLKYVRNMWSDGFIPYKRTTLAYNQTNVPTGRFSSSSSDGTERIIAKFSKKTGEFTSFSYDPGGGDCGFNSQGVAGDSPRVLKVKRIKKLPTLEAMGLNLSSPYSEDVKEQMYKAFSEV